MKLVEFTIRAIVVGFVSGLLLYAFLPRYIVTGAAPAYITVQDRYTGEVWSCMVDSIEKKRK